LVSLVDQLRDACRLEESGKAGNDFIVSTFTVAGAGEKGSVREEAANQASEVVLILNVAHETVVRAEERNGAAGRRVGRMD
jgi:hypothetical protein